MSELVVVVIGLVTTHQHYLCSRAHSQEEIESLRERMQAQTSLVVVGSADDSLRVGHTKRQIEGVTQAMVDNMIIDEVAEFAATCIVNPPAPRDVTAELAANAKLANGPAATAASSASGCASTSCVAQAQKKRKGSVSLESAEPPVKALKTTAARVNMAGKIQKPNVHTRIAICVHPQLFCFRNFHCIFLFFPSGILNTSRRQCEAKGAAQRYCSILFLCLFTHVPVTLRTPI